MAVEWVDDLHWTVVVWALLMWSVLGLFWMADHHKYNKPIPGIIKTIFLLIVLGPFVWVLSLLNIANMVITRIGRWIKK